MSHIWISHVTYIKESVMYTHESYNCNASRNSPNRPVTHTTTLYRRMCLWSVCAAAAHTHTHTVACSTYAWDTRYFGQVCGVHSQRDSLTCSHDTTWLVRDTTHSCVPWLSHMCRGSFTYVKWLTDSLTRHDVNRSWHDSFMCAITQPCVPWISHVCHASFTYVTWFTDSLTQRDVTHSWHDSFVTPSAMCAMNQSCVPCIIHICDMIHWLAQATRRDSFVTRLIRDTTHSWHDSFVTRLMNVRHMLHDSVK